MKNIQVLVLLIFSCFSCNERKSDLKLNNSQNQNKLNYIDSSKSLKTDSRYNLKGIKLLKSVLDSENHTYKNKSIKFFDKKSIEDFLFIRELFPTEEIDSIEIYGNDSTQKTLSVNFPENSLLTIYFNHKRLAKNQLNLIQYEWNDKSKFARAFYEKGAITFELDGQLCLYSVNSCVNNGRLIERIDSKIKAELNKNSYSFERIITTCGEILFKRKMN